MKKVVFFCLVTVSLMLCGMNVDAATASASQGGYDDPASKDVFGILTFCKDQECDDDTYKILKSADEISGSLETLGFVVSDVRKTIFKEVDDMDFYEEDEEPEVFSYDALEKTYVKSGVTVKITVRDDEYADGSQWPLELKINFDSSAAFNEFMSNAVEAGFENGSEAGPLFYSYKDCMMGAVLTIDANEAVLTCSNPCP